MFNVQASGTVISRRCVTRKTVFEIQSIILSANQETILMLYCLFFKHSAAIRTKVDATNIGGLQWYVIKSKGLSRCVPLPTTVCVLRHSVGKRPEQRLLRRSRREE